MKSFLKNSNNNALFQRQAYRAKVRDIERLLAEITQRIEHDKKVLHDYETFLGKLKTQRTEFLQQNAAPLNPEKYAHLLQLDKEIDTLENNPTFEKLKETIANQQMQLESCQKRLEKVRENAPGKPQLGE